MLRHYQEVKQEVKKLDQAARICKSKGFSRCCVTRRLDRCEARSLRGIYKVELAQHAPRIGQPRLVIPNKCTDRQLQCQIHVHTFPDLAYADTLATSDTTADTNHLAYSPSNKELIFRTTPN